VSIPLLLTGLALGFAAAVPAPSGPAHEAEHTQVKIAFFADGTFQADVLHPPAWLRDRLEPLAAAPDVTPRIGRGRDRRLVELEGVFAEWVWLFFDGQRVRVDPEFLPTEIPSEDETTLATMRIRGRVPEGATTFSWAYGLVLDPYPLQVRARDGTVVTRWLEGPVESERFAIAALTPPSRWSVIASYLALGFSHILPKGLDHILFVIGIYLLSTRLRPMLAQVTAFTVAHTITLALTIFGVLSLPPRIVEPLIALSVAYVAIENVFTTELKPWRLALVFSFGLLHGMGFAGVLSGLGLPPAERVAALLSFNLGVEAGQLAVIAALFLTLGWLRDREWYRQRTVLPISLTIAAVGLYWTVSRIAAG
jgi:hydrogenase/urease accessory protein HupE